MISRPRKELERGSKKRRESKVNPEVTESRDALGDLVAPLAPETFTTEYWGRKPLFVKGAPDKLQRLIPGGFQRDDLYRAVRQAAARDIADFKVRTGKHRSHNSGHYEQTLSFPRIQPDQIEMSLAAGANIRADNIFDDRVARFATALKARLNHPGKLRLLASLSSQGYGWPVHFDGSSVLVIHCEGRKQYLISSSPVCAWPTATTFLSSNGAGEYSHETEPWEEIPSIDTGNLIEVVLEPGDILFMPPGTIHATEALSDITLGLILEFDHINFFDLVRPVLERTLLCNPDWRHLPLISAPGQSSAELPAEAKAFFADRLAELRAALDALAPDSFDLNREWKRMIADPGESIVASLPSSHAESESRPVERREILRITQKAPLTCAEGTDSDGVNYFYLYFANQEASVDEEWIPFLKTMVEKQRFTAESATQWAGDSEGYPWETAQEYLQTLLELGLLERSLTVTSP